MPDIKISIITVCYNDCEGLRRTMDSVAQQTAVRGADYEYIVIDGGSTDGSAELLKSRSDEVDALVSEPDQGIYYAMNKGIALAHGTFCNFMNAGDTFAADNTVARVVERLADKDYYIGHQLNLPPHKKFIKAPKQITATQLAAKALSHQATFIRTSLLKARPYQVEYHILADWEQMLYELILHNASYERLDFTVAHFDTTGLSAQSGRDGRYGEEQRRMLHTLFSPRLAQALIGKDRTERKMLHAISKPDAWERDMKLLRNLLKVLPKDLWHKITGKGRKG